MLNELQTHEGEWTADGLVPVLFARARESADSYRCLLERAGITAVVGDDSPLGTRGLGVAVLVPESLHERASEIVSSVDAASAKRDHDYDDYEDEEEEDDDDDYFPDDSDDDDEDDDDDLLDDDDEDFDDD